MNSPDTIISTNKPLFFNMNSILLAVCTSLILGSIGWVGRTTAKSNDSITKLETSLPYIRESQTELKNQVQALASTLSSMVTRSEMEAKLTEVNRVISRNTLQLETLQRDLQAILRK